MLERIIKHSAVDGWISSPRTGNRCNPIRPDCHRHSGKHGSKFLSFIRDSITRAVTAQCDDRMVTRCLQCFNAPANEGCLSSSTDRNITHADHWYSDAGWRSQAHIPERITGENSHSIGKCGYVRNRRKRCVQWTACGFRCRCGTMCRAG
jgi:hypothetical protein